MAVTTITNYLKHLVPSCLDKWYTHQKVCDKSSTPGRKTGTVLQFFQVVQSFEWGITIKERKYSVI